MSDSSRPARPQQVTTAVVLSVVACVLAVVNLFDTRDDLRSTSFEDRVADGQGGIGGFASSSEQVVRVLEALVLVSGALAAAAAVLAVYAWQRNRAAWIGFFVVAGLLALTLPVAGVLPVLLLASGATFLAGRPARDWFSDRAPARAGAAVALTEQGPRDGGPLPHSPEAHPTPPPWPGRFGGGSTAMPPEGQPDPFAKQPQGQSEGGQAPPQQAWQQGWPPPQPQAPWGQQPTRDPDKRPGTVTAACITTWVGTLLVAALTALIAVALSADRGAFVREFQRQAATAELQVTVDQVIATAWTMAVVGLVWCLAAAVLAVLAFRRSRGGRIGLAVSAALTALLSLLLILSVVAAIPLLLGIAVLVLLFTGGANDWYARRGAGQAPHGWSPPGGPPPGQHPPHGQHPPYGQPPPPPPGRQGPW